MSLPMPPHLSSKEVDEYLDENFTFTNDKNAANYLSSSVGASKEDEVIRHMARPRNGFYRSNVGRLIFQLIDDFYEKERSLLDEDGYIEWCGSGDAYMWRADAFMTEEELDSWVGCGEYAVLDGPQD